MEGPDLGAFSFGLDDLAEAFASLSMFPLFEIAHYILMCQAVRSDSGGLTLSRKHPLANWVCCMLMCSAGGFISSLLLGLPLIGPLSKTPNVLLASAIWYVVFYAPFDVFHKVVTFPPVLMLVYCVKELHRSHTILGGVLNARKVYSSGIIVQICIGIVRGAGSGFMLNFQRLVRGKWSPETNQILHPTVVLKECLISAILFTLPTGVLPINQDQLLLLTGIVMVAVKVTLTLTNVGDPFKPIENVLCMPIFGRAEVMAAEKKKKE
ncbi:trimeric intracellular cation channel type B-A-like isoform X1 [Branchiostoma lanceolatum]|uniref:TMEM38A protein n=1 Tax=Branchiostoma lanceolatum TaxID=7740 RepID=A0A8K0A8M0_BRALA|nr:TMEM38A [Branchiostoma lanceolatum]